MNAFHVKNNRWGKIPQNFMLELRGPTREKVVELRAQQMNANINRIRNSISL